MTPDNRCLFGPIKTFLKDGRTVTIRALERSDGEALTAFYAGVPRSDFRFYCPHPLDREHALANAATADSPTEIVLVIETTDHRIGGYAWLRWTTGSNQCTFGICIHPDFQNAGTGRIIMTRLMEIGRTLAPPVIQLTVQQANTRGVKLYTSMGFKVIREQVRPKGFQPGLDAELEYAMERPARHDTNH